MHLHGHAHHKGRTSMHVFGGGLPCPVILIPMAVLQSLQVDGRRGKPGSGRLRPAALCQRKAGTWQGRGENRSWRGLMRKSPSLSAGRGSLGNGPPGGECDEIQVFGWNLVGIRSLDKSTASTGSCPAFWQESCCYPSCWLPSYPESCQRAY